ncbi:MAG TPA: DUF4157 domain-containing protein [Longimicrobiales bacterium]
MREALAAPGRPLAPATRALLEARLGHDFGEVRVHTGPEAEAAAAALNARAFTVGRDVVFNRREYEPTSQPGLRLLAHELVHTVQQGEVRGGLPARLPIGRDADSDEREADRAARAVAGTGFRTGSGGRPEAAPHLPSAATSASARRLAAPRIQRFPLPNPGVIIEYGGPLMAARTAATRAAYSQAVAQLQNINATLHRYLAAVTPGAGPTPIKTGQLTTTDTPPVTLRFTFNLDVQFTSLPAGRFAEFDGGTPSLTGAGNARTMVANMVMRIASPMPTSGGGSLAASLYHEGLHMLLFMEDLLPTNPPSPHMAALMNYRRIARGHPNHARLLAELEIFIELDLQRRHLTPPADYARQGAQEIMAHVIEEKYVFDQERRQFNTQITNRSLALTYVLDGFRSLGVQATATDRDVVGIVNRLTAILDEIDRQLRPRPAPATPAAPAAPAAPAQPPAAQPAAPPARPPSP